MKLSKELSNEYKCFLGFNLTKATFMELKDYYKAKNDFLLNSNSETRYLLKFYFFRAHTSLKADQSEGRISPATLQELTDVLRKGV